LYGILVYLLYMFFMLRSIVFARHAIWNEYCSIKGVFK